MLNNGEMSRNKRESRRAVWLDHDEIILDIAHEDGAIAVRFLGSDGKPGQPRHLVSSWKPGDPVWQGRIDGACVAVQARPIIRASRFPSMSSPKRRRLQHG